LLRRPRPSSAAPCSLASPCEANRQGCTSGCEPENGLCENDGRGLQADSSANTAEWGYGELGQLRIGRWDLRCACQSADHSTACPARRGGRLRVDLARRPRGVPGLVPIEVSL